MENNSEGNLGQIIQETINIVYALTRTGAAVLATAPDLLVVESIRLSDKT
jgi:hypothetical protein